MSRQNSYLASWNRIVAIGCVGRSGQPEERIEPKQQKQPELLSEPRARSRWRLRRCQLTLTCLDLINPTVVWE